MTIPLFDRPTLTDAPTPNLRPYQERAIRLARMHAAAGKKRILLTLPTATGKMVIIAAIVKTSTTEVLFVCHRMELVEQCVEQLARQGICNVGVMRGDDERVNPSASVQVTSIQTLSRRPKPPAGLVIIDEAHRALSDSYLALLQCYPDAVVLGFTASPCRGDGRPMGDVFEVLETVATYSELLKRPEWLAEPDCYGAPAKPNLSELVVKHGDYEETALGEVMSQKHLVGNLLDHWLALAHKYPVVDPRTKRVIPGEFTAGERRRTFIFAVNIAHSKLICERFAAAGVRIAHLDGTTPEDERRAMLADLRTGKLECISNCNVLLEGVDAPEAKCVVHARPTWSLVLWLQSVGRALRPWNGIRPLILDHADNWSRHGAPHEDRVWSLTNTAGRKASSKPMKLCKTCFAYVGLSLSVCPYCKTIFTAAEMREPPKENAQSLVMRELAPENRRREFFDRMATLARVRGFKPGFAAAKHKEEFGDWPPNDWSEGLKALFASDVFWQQRLADRTRQKEAEDTAWEEPLPDTSMDVGDDPWGLAEEIETNEEVLFEAYEDGSETFSAWTRREFGEP